MIWQEEVTSIGLSRFAPHLQCISLVLATAQLVLGSYIFNSLLHYGKWVILPLPVPSILDGRPSPAILSAVA
jgi:hypothetical protein